jgi:hypothetical protein
MLWDFYQANPQSFTKNDNTIYRSAITLSKFAQETISSAYLRGDIQLLERSYPPGFCVNWLTSESPTGRLVRCCALRLSLLLCIGDPARPEAD